MARQINKAGLDLIKRFEGLRLYAYPDPATGGAPWTIGYGHTGKDVFKGQFITGLRAEELLEQDLKKFCTVTDKYTDGKLTDNQFAACVSLVFNIGPANFLNSTLLRLLKEGKHEEASKQFIRWNKAAGKVMDGLTRRREAETRLFLTP